MQAYRAQLLRFDSQGQALYDSDGLLVVDGDASGVRRVIVQAIGSLTSRSVLVEQSRELGLALRQRLVQDLQAGVDVVDAVAAHLGVEAHGSHVARARDLGEPRLRGRRDSSDQRVGGHPPRGHAEHDQDERDGDEPEDDESNHAPILRRPHRLYSDVPAGGDGVDERRAEASAAMMVPTASSTSSVRVSRSRSPGLIVPRAAAVSRSQSSRPPQ